MKNRGKKTRGKNFQKTHEQGIQKVRKHVFYKQINIVTIKWGEKTREKCFSRNTSISQANNDGKKSTGKSAKTRFLKTHEYRDQKMGGKNARKFFSKNTRISRIINNGKKSSGKSAKTRFFYKHTNIVTKKWGEKTREKNCHKTHEQGIQKLMEKIVWKKCENTFFINT